MAPAASATGGPTSTFLGCSVCAHRAGRSSSRSRRRDRDGPCTNPPPRCRALLAKLPEKLETARLLLQKNRTPAPDVEEAGDGARKSRRASLTPCRRQWWLEIPSRRAARRRTSRSPRLRLLPPRRPREMNATHDPPPSAAAPRSPHRSRLREIVVAPLSSSGPCHDVERASRPSVAAANDVHHSSHTPQARTARGECNRNGTVDESGSTRGFGACSPARTGK